MLTLKKMNKNKIEIKGKSLFLSRLNRFLGYCLGKVQGLSLYKKIVTNFCPEVKIAEAKEEDDQKIFRKVNLQLNKQTCCDQGKMIFVAKKDKRIIGLVTLVRNQKKDSPYHGCWIFGLRVSIFFRRMGVGEKLVHAALEKAKGEGVKQVFLAVFRDNFRAVTLYEKLGFKQIIIPSLENELEREKNSIGRRRIAMAKDLENSK